MPEALITWALSVPPAKSTFSAVMTSTETFPETVTVPSGAEIDFNDTALGGVRTTLPPVEVRVCNFCAGAPSMTMSPTFSTESELPSRLSLTSAGRTKAPLLAM